MEQVHGVDVSWMTQGIPKDRFNKNPFAPEKTPGPAQPRHIPNSPLPQLSPQTTNEKTEANVKANGQAETPPTSGTNTPRRLSRSGSVEKQYGANGTSPHRRNSWFSNISAKFSGSSNSPPTSGSAQPNQQQPANQQQNVQQPNQSSPADAEPIVPKVTPTKNAVLQHGLKPEGDGPYTPAPPKSGQAGFLGVFRRLSSSGPGNLGPNGKLNHGLVERKILNVDRDRERSPMLELKDNKLRKVSFLVDVEIAPMPKYADGEVEQPKAVDHAQKKKLTEKGEGDALKNPKAAEAQKDAKSTSETIEECKPEEPKKDETASSDVQKSDDGVDNSTATGPAKEKETTKKKEKKKRSEEERKARKEKRRKLAEDNGTIPVELHYDSSDSSDSLSTGAPKSTSFPTTNPVRIYRRCCQLRETPILKRITEQLGDSANISSETGFINKLDLTGYWLQLPDLITLGDYLAVVPVREVVLANSGLSDEGLRVILAGLLAAKRPEELLKRRKLRNSQHEQGGVVELLVLKDNKLGPDGWKHISLFIYKCRSLKYLDLSGVPFPRQAPMNTNASLQNGVHIPLAISNIFAKVLAERPAGSMLEMLNIAETEPSMEQFGTIIDGIIKCGIKRLGVARNQLDTQGLQHLVRYLKGGFCEGLDLGGNDLRDHVEAITSALKGTDTLWALSISGCNLNPPALAKVLPILALMQDLRFIDLSHNHELFQSTPSAVGLLRRYLPKLVFLKRLHLSDVNMTPEQAIAIVEVIPEVQSLCHISLLGNKEIVKLADAKSEEDQEEACALYASLMAATRLSKSMICVDIEVPSEGAAEIVKAMAKQVVAYCLRNMEQMHDSDISATLSSALSDAHGDALESKEPGYPDVLVHLVGHDVLVENEPVEDDDSAPDEDYVIGGTGVVKALACCLRNRGDESHRGSGEFIRGPEGAEADVLAEPTLATGRKAKDLSKHLLAGARKIRLRLQPALHKARSQPSDEQNLRKLIFLDDTLQGIIKRFEDEFPDTREHHVEAVETPTFKHEVEVLSSSPPATEDAKISDGEDETELHPAKPLSRNNSILSRELAEEEGRVHRVGHRFRTGLSKQIDLLGSINDIGTDPKHARVLQELAEDVGGELLQRVKEKGAIQAFKDHNDLVLKSMQENDPEYYEQFVDSQEKARANMHINEKKEADILVNENAIED